MFKLITLIYLITVIYAPLAVSLVFRTGSEEISPRLQKILRWRCHRLNETTITKKENVVWKFQG